MWLSLSAFCCFDISSATCAADNPVLSSMPSPSASTHPNSCPKRPVARGLAAVGLAAVGLAAAGLEVGGWAAVGLAAVGLATGGGDGVGDCAGCLDDVEAFGGDGGGLALGGAAVANGFCDGAVSAALLLCCPFPSEPPKSSVAPVGLGGRSTARAAEKGTGTAVTLVTNGSLEGSGAALPCLHGSSRPESVTFLVGALGSSGANQLIGFGIQPKNDVACVKTDARPPVPPSAICFLSADTNCACGRVKRREARGERRNKK